MLTKIILNLSCACAFAAVAAAEAENAIYEKRLENVNTARYVQNSMMRSTRCRTAWGDQETLTKFMCLSCIALSWEEEKKESLCGRVTKIERKKIPLFIVPKWLNENENEFKKTEKK